ncbi:hypothetical protein [Paenibacillus sp. J2TS4]|uniref:phosphorylase family protein n=1 Tax=Paenibacillus sp. J2TS4 TaxID=2807194 RepID=UPI001B0C034C|nr:hypothetical protein [Paenibacillus sp. J2TS4]GIP31236.1 hypothetical protein J2TS4_04460 [Paenibacillus sp. J2TS4]
MSYRYITPEQVMKNRFNHFPRPRWKTAVLCFRDYRGSQVLVQGFKAAPVGYKVLYGMEEHEGSPFVYEAAVAGEPIGIVTRCQWGGPQAAILVEELAELGVRYIIGYGAAGSIRQSIAQGEQLVANSAMAGDGTSRAYRSDAEKLLTGSPELIRLAKEAAGALGFPLREAVAVTADALYRETDEWVEACLQKGADVVNMETGPLYAAAAACGVRSVWLGHVSDCLVREKWHDWHVDLIGMAEATSQIALGLAQRLAEMG